MTRNFLFAILLFGLALGPSLASAAPQESSRAWNDYYLYDGITLQRASGDPGQLRNARWQVWLNAQDLRLYNGIAYARWGALQGPSAELVMKQLALWQDFERADTAFFGSAAWRRFTFTHPIGPIALTSNAEGRESPALVAAADELSRRLSVVVAAVIPSLLNNQTSDLASSVAAYFQQIRGCLQSIVKFYDQLERLSGQPRFLNLRLARLRAEVRQAEENAPKITALLPSVHLPTRKSWMTQTEYEGSDGIRETTIAEIGSAAWVRQEWSGGDGSMAGAVMVTVVPYRDIKSVEVIGPFTAALSSWTLRIQPAGRAWFPQSITSPARVTSKRSYAPVDLTVTEPLLFLRFSSARDAQDAFAFFLYHGQLGR